MAIFFFTSMKTLVFMVKMVIRFVFSLSFLSSISFSYIHHPSHVSHSSSRVFFSSLCIILPSHDLFLPPSSLFCLSSLSIIHPYLPPPFPSSLVHSCFHVTSLYFVLVLVRGWQQTGASYEPFDPGINLYPDRRCAMIYDVSPVTMPEVFIGGSRQFYHWSFAVNGSLSVYHMDGTHTTPAKAILANIRLEPLLSSECFSDAEDETEAPNFSGEYAADQEPVIAGHYYNYSPLIPIPIGVLSINADNSEGWYNSGMIIIGSIFGEKIAFDGIDGFFSNSRSHQNIIPIIDPLMLHGDYMRKHYDGPAHKIDGDSVISKRHPNIYSIYDVGVDGDKFVVEIFDLGIILTSDDRQDSTRIGPDIIPLLCILWCEDNSNKSLASWSTTETFMFWIKLFKVTNGSWQRLRASWLLFNRVIRWLLSLKSGFLNWVESFTLMGSIIICWINSLVIPSSVHYLMSAMGNTYSVIQLFGHHNPFTQSCGNDVVQHWIIWFYYLDDKLWSPFQTLSECIMNDSEEFYLHIMSICYVIL